MPSFNRKTEIRIPPDLRAAMMTLAEEQKKNIAGLAKGAVLLVYRDRLIGLLTEPRYMQLVKEYAEETD